MAQCIWIKNGQVIDPANKRNETSDVYVKDGKIVDTLDIAEKESAQIIEANGCVVCPGLIDIHVHFREPGQTHKETITSGSMAAAAGGFTTVVCMPNTSPALDNVGTLELVQKTIKRDAVINVLLTGTLTMGRKGEELTPMGALKDAGVVAVTDDGDCIQSNAIMRQAIEYALMFNLPVMDHCQDASLTSGSVIHEGEWSLRLGLKGWPRAAEDIIVARNIALSESTGAHIHMQHVSSGSAVDLIRQAKRKGIRVTAEATPHHIALSDSCIQEYDTHFKMNPPLREKTDQEAIIKGLLDGTIDIIATDHAPHAKDEKDDTFDSSPFGITGLETSLPVCLETLVNTGNCDLSYLIALMTHKPAELINISKGTLSTGADADITIFDPLETFVYNKTFSKSRNSPWWGQSLTGKVKYTICAGRVVYEDDASAQIFSAKTNNSRSILSTL
ncbi:MAG: dihydroorotase [Verrucomicrobia bacterium CG_4_10_14_3_um_filter_43_23]|nr:MAG: dihydroorotase [Verrucomicrobia bacterium CG1_02_43_26]PIP59226.1 MAG: dihydroorotase [Verrucomicrobia bacterium CG22_combo_CG10-13_8_21_14_all_43_17]PIX58590.1 MAG: dihydroorotase [Verrucomicrobia bacterium CG_4_10_14_3_um_filter_43_23]PIY61042.1 MAG: dihydroorotase [Verrucomicrobia bacterium CG_4_10_14_0_8_um_filter_43_34]PJA43883.1 MAG: dihydroorotase [Verrucomicrobia bacterium CG_4_9_14_3_um_filter_43_20]